MKLDLDLDFCAVSCYLLCIVPTLRRAKDCLGSQRLGGRCSSCLGLSVSACRLLLSSCRGWRGCCSLASVEESCSIRCLVNASRPCEVEELCLDVTDLALLVHDELAVALKLAPKVVVVLL